MIGCVSTRSDSAVKLVSCYVPRGEVRRPFLYFVPSRRVILDNKPFTLNEACVAKQDGAVEVKEPLEERSEALENPKVVAEILVEIRNPGAEIYYWIDRQTLRAEKFKESNIELFEAIYEAVERVDEETDEIIVEKLSLIRLLRLVLIKLPEARQLMIILPENE